MIKIPYNEEFLTEFKTVCESGKSKPIIDFLEKQLYKDFFANHQMKGVTEQIIKSAIESNKPQMLALIKEAMGGEEKLKEALAGYDWSAAAVIGSGDKKLAELIANNKKLFKEKILEQPEEAIIEAAKSGSVEMLKLVAQTIGKEKFEKMVAGNYAEVIRAAILSKNPEIFKSITDKVSKDKVEDALEQNARENIYYTIKSNNQELIDLVTDSLGGEKKFKSYIKTHYIDSVKAAIESGNIKLLEMVKGVLGGKSFNEALREDQTFPRSSAIGSNNKEMLKRITDTMADEGKIKKFDEAIRNYNFYAVKAAIETGNMDMLKLVADALGGKAKLREAIRNMDDPHIVYEAVKSGNRDMLSFVSETLGYKKPLGEMLSQNNYSLVKQAVKNCSENEACYKALGEVLNKGDITYSKLWVGVKNVPATTKMVMKNLENKAKKPEVLLT
jgi:hypothetical protein